MKSAEINTPNKIGNKNIKFSSDQDIKNQYTDTIPSSELLISKDFYSVKKNPVTGFI